MNRCRHTFNSQFTRFQSNQMKTGWQHFRENTFSGFKRTFAFRRIVFKWQKRAREFPAHDAYILRNSKRNEDFEFYFFAYLR